MKLKTLMILTLGIVISCKETNTKAFTNDQNLKIETLLQKMYSLDLKGDALLKDSLLFSKEVIALNNKCDSLIKASNEKILNSDQPDSKPIVMEGSKISSLYEGVTDFKILKITNNASKTEVDVLLSNRNYPQQKPWKEKIIFTNNNDFKIDNIFFNKKIYHSDSVDPNLKETLTLFYKQTL